MYPDYQQAILRIYQQKKNRNQLMPELMRPTPGKIQLACLKIFTKNYDKRDEEILGSFFLYHPTKEAYVKAIEGLDIDKFRPLVKLLRGQIAVTEDKNFNLLAWLLDFHPRPYQADFDYTTIGRETKSKGGGVDPPGPTWWGRLISLIQTRPAKKTWIGATVLFLLLAGGMIYQYEKGRPGTDTNHGFVVNQPKGKCMYWAEDHYVAGPCNLLHRDTPVVQLDSFKLLNFKKIQDWSSLNRSEVGKVWWARVNKNLELYTMEGFHPIDTNRGLRPLSDYMFNEYIRPVLK